MKKLFFFAALALALVIGTPALAGALTPGSGGGVLSPGFWKLVGTALLPTDVANTIGSAVTRIAAIYVTTLDATTITFSGASTGHLIPSANNQFNIGAPTSSWKDVYASGTVYGNSALFAGNVTSTANNIALYSPSVDRFFRMNMIADGTSQLQSSAGMTISSVLSSAIQFGNNVTPSGNNVRDLGAFAYAWKDVYASGTVYASSTLVGSGIVSAPTYSFLGDTNTGMYSPAADNLALGVGGTAILALNGSNVVAYKSTVVGSNNSYDLGAYAYAWRDLYTSGTIYNSGGLQLYGGNVTSTGIIYTGGISQTDPGSPNPARMIELTATPAVGTPQSLDFGMGGDNWLSLYAQSNGVANGYINPAILAFKSIVPDQNNLINLGSTGTAWANIYASGTVFSATSTIAQRIISSLNNTSDIGFWGNAMRDIYASGTLRIGGAAATSTADFRTNGATNGKGTCHKDSDVTGATLYWWWDLAQPTSIATSTTACDL